MVSISVPTPLVRLIVAALSLNENPVESVALNPSVASHIESLFPQ